MNKWIESASRDLAEQLHAVRQISASLQTTKVQEPSQEKWLGHSPVMDELNFDESKCESAEVRGEPQALTESQARQGPKRQHFSLVDFAERVEWANGLAGETSEVMRGALRKAGALGQTRFLTLPPTGAALAAIAEDFPNFLEVTEFVRRRVLLCEMVSNAPFKLPPILLSGPPGTGKTAFSQRLAQVVNTPITCIDVSTLDTACKLTGLDAGYSTGHPGLVWDALQQECMSPIILLDELDKHPTDIRYASLACLLGLLEPMSARRYQDSALRLPIDASYVIWIATCNNLNEIDAPLRSRFKSFHISPPDKKQSQAVVRSVHRALRVAEDWAQAFEPELSLEVETTLIGYTPRAIRQALEDGYAQAAECGRRKLLPQDLSSPTRYEQPRTSMGFI